MTWILEGETKTCADCGLDFAIDLFREIKSSRSNKSYRHNKCDTCRRAYNRQYYLGRKAADPEYIQYSRHSLLRKYGLTPEDYDDMVQDQGNKCAICGREPGGNGVSKHHLVVDHDHETGTVRQLLCDFCNRGLGIFRDDPELLMAAAAYLLQHAEVDA